MTSFDRRELLAAAASLGAVLALPTAARAARRQPRIDAAAFPQGVASGDPTPDGFILWTRRPPLPASVAHRLTIEIAADEDFSRIVAGTSARLAEDSDWTCRVLVAGLQPDRTYWYRFIDEHGLASRTGRSFTAPAADTDRAVRFAFVSCQNVNLGHSTPYRQMIRDDAARTDEDQLRFVLHLGDFIYEMVWYPEDNPRGQRGRPVRDTIRLPTGEKIGDYHVPTGVADYRAIYRAYLADPDIQDARARWPFICVWDNHEFSNKGWQSQLAYDGPRAAQRLKVAANQAWFEYIPARVRRPGSDRPIERFTPPSVQNVPLADFDASGLSREPNNLAAINSLLIARALRWGRNVELILTDNRSFRSQPVMESDDAKAFATGKVPYFAPQEIVEILDAGRSYGGGNPPATVRSGGKEIANPRRTAPAGSMLGAEQKTWFLDRVRTSRATWKLWGNSVGLLDVRTDPAGLPQQLASAWPSDGFGITNLHDWGGYPTERAELLRAAETAGVTNLVSLAGDRHAFFAGVVAPELPPKGFRPVAAEFMVGSVCTPTVAEVTGAVLPRDHPLAPLYVSVAEGAAQPRPAMNVTVLHGVRSSLTLAETGDLDAALANRNPQVAPHLAFADMAGHGFAVVRADGRQLDVEFVCMPAPVRAEDDRLLYRVTHRVESWRPGEQPVVRRIAAEGPGLAARYLDRAPA